jgi:hypothetical protein
MFSSDDIPFFSCIVFAAYSYSKIVPVVCLYAGEVDMLERVQGTFKKGIKRMKGLTWYF